jgi:hypothetical protein
MFSCNGIHTETDSSSRIGSSPGYIAAGTAAHQQVNAAWTGNPYDKDSGPQPVIHMMTVNMATHTTQFIKVAKVIMTAPQHAP